MFSNLQATLYDFFGYLLPGAVFLVGLAILFWAIYIPQTPLTVVELSFQMQVVFLVLIYILGHLIQALGNLLVRLLPSPEDIVLSERQLGGFPCTLVRSAKEKTSEMLGVDLKDISSEWLVRICDEVLLQQGVCTDREIYQYREGFYRGLTVSFFILTLSLTVRAVIPGTSVRFTDTVQGLSVLIVLFFIALSLVGAWFTFLRYQRFGRYRVTQAVLGFLVLQSPKKIETGKEKAKNA